MDEILDREDLDEFAYAVVGGGIAGVSCVEQILEYEPEAKILLISASSVVKEASNVTRLTKTLQDFILVEKSLKSFKDVHQSVQVFHDEVLTLDPAQHVVVTKAGKKFKYKKICICTGGKPKVLFTESDFVIGIRDTESVQDLAVRIAKARRVILLGNGGIATEFVHEVSGVEIIWAVKDKSISAHFVDAGAAEFFIHSKLKGGEEDDRNLDEQKPRDVKHGEETKPPSVIASEESKSKLSKRMKYTLSSFPAAGKDQPLDNNAGPGSALGPDWHQGVQLKGLENKKNVRILCETECLRVLNGSDLTELDKRKTIDSNTTEWPVCVELTNGEIIGADLVISATGVRPNCDWMITSGCDYDPEKGIFVDSAMRSSVKDVFAAGDVCFPKWPWSKHWFQMKLWTQARQMGLYAGKSMYLSTCHDESSDETEEIDLDFCFEIFSHVTKFFGFKVVLLGLFNGQGIEPCRQHLIVRCTKNMEYIKVVMEDWRMQGAILIGETGLEETFENLILNQVDLSPYGEDLLNPDIDIEDYFD